MATTITNTITTLQKNFTDLDFNFTMNPGTGDVSKKTNIEDIKQSVKNLLLTKIYERPFQPNLYSQLYDLLFEPFSPTIKFTLETVINNVLTSYEPRINVLSVGVNDRRENNALEISLSFEIVGVNVAANYSILVSRIR
ncbi:MAG: GPW/gp25 family protein [Bacilli bacterium]|nr:GPW/gp25 family protein [Bacilli bacterium]